MSEWWWVRHGPTHERRFVGWRDVPADLSDTALLARLDAYLPRAALLVSSDLLRARATADAIAGGRRRLPDAPALREFNFGLWDGLDFEQVSARDPELSRAYWERPSDVRPPGGESWNEVAARVGGFVSAASAGQRGGQFVAVAHQGVILTQIQAALGCAPHEVLAHRIDNLSVTHISLGGDGPRVRVINHIP